MTKIRRLLLILPFAIIGLGLLSFAANVPIGDDYDAILGFLNYPWPERLVHLADFHNEHRIIPTRLVSEFVYLVLGQVDFRIIIWIGNIGWWLFAAGFATLFVRHGGIAKSGAIFATWMLVGYYDQENAFWAMTSVQNHWVIGFAFAACLSFSRRANTRWFAAALSFAIAATFTSGSGMLVFPALALMELCDFIFNQDRAFSKRRIIGTSVFALVAISSCAFYLHGMPHEDITSLSVPEAPIQRVIGILGFFFCFFGNLLPFVWPAFIAGVGIVAWGLAISWLVPRYRQTSLAIFAFLAFLVATILVGAIFRGDDAAVGLWGRYRLISVAVIVSLLYLTLVETQLSEKLKTHLLLFSLTGCILISVVYLARGLSYNSAHKQSLNDGLAQWPTSVDGLDYPTNNFGRIHASAILQKSVENKVFHHQWMKP